MNSNRKVVGILSMQRVLNYGSFLQAYALRQLLLHVGADEVFFIDIKSGRPLPGYMPVKVTSRCVRVLRIFMTGRLPVKIRDMRFEKKMRAGIARNLSMLELDARPANGFDVAVIGSDEVFNCCQVSSWGYTSQLYGNVPEAKKVISYAGSFGHTTHEQLVEFGLDREICETMQTMAAISVRDRNSYEIVETITGSKPEIHLDPVLIYGYEEEIVARNISYPLKYMVVYSYQGRINDKKEIKEIVSFAKSKGLRLISVFCRYDWCDEAVIPDTPFDVLAWFKGAEYIVTDTFHGTIFSVVTHRPFCTLIRDSNHQKLDFLLSMLSLCDRGCSDIGATLAKSIDYDSVEEILRRERARAWEYLKREL